MAKKQGTQTVDQSPWGPAQGSLIFGLSELDRIYGRPASAPTRTGPFGRFFGGGYYDGDPRSGSTRFISRPGPVPAAPTGALMPAPNPVKEYGLLDPASAELLRTIRGERMTSNPHLEALIGRSMADVNSNFAGMSRYGSGAHMDQLFSKAAAPIRYADYAQERANQLAAVNAAPGFEMAPYQLHAARQAAPYEGIRNYLGLAGAVGGQGGSQTTPIYSNPLAGAAGGALAGAGLGSMMAAPGATGLAAVGGWPFLLGGALLGGLMS